MRSVLFSIILSTLAAQAAAQPVALDRATPSLPTAGERRAADVASWATALTVVALDAGESWRCKPPSSARGACLKTFGLRVGLTYGAAYAVKALVHRSRPCTPDCGIDDPDSSFFSAHTTIAF